MSKNKVITGYVRMELPAGKATPGAKVGQALGQRGVNLMEFCKAFNAASASFFVNWLFSAMLVINSALFTIYILLK